MAEGGRSPKDASTAETWLRLVAWSAALCRILHSGVLQKCAIIGGGAYESLTLHHKRSCIYVTGSVEVAPGRVSLRFDIPRRQPPWPVSSCQRLAGFEMSTDA